MRGLGQRLAVLLSSSVLSFFRLFQFKVYSFGIEVYSVKEVLFSVDAAYQIGVLLLGKRYVGILYAVLVGASSDAVVECERSIEQWAVLLVGYPYFESAEEQAVSADGYGAFLFARKPAGG